MEQNDDKEWYDLLDINQVGVVRTNRAAMPALKTSRNASIVNTCSVVADVGLPDRDLYAATKGALRSLTFSMAADPVSENIRVNCVTPATTDAPGSLDCWSSPTALTVDGGLTGLRLHAG